MASSWRKYIFILCMVISLFVIVGMQGVPWTEVPPVFPRVTLPGTEVRTLKSSTTGRDYDLYIRFPDGYTQSEEKKYPVLYVLDGQWDFKLLDSIYGGLFYDKFTPEILIVGVTYSGDNPDYNTLRAMDYTPPSTGQFVPGFGDAPKFFDFFKKELIPFIEANYRADTSQKMLLGNSYGGLFTLYAMFTEPELFSGYVASSPAVPYGGGVIFKQEAKYASKRQDLPVRLFIGAGELEDLAPPVKEFIQIVDKRNYKNLKMETRIIEGERHASNKPEVYNRGLRFVSQSK